MQIVYHLGAHCTDEDRLVRALIKNRGTLAPGGIAVPTPRLYRQILPKLAKSLRGDPAASETQQIVLDAVLETEEVERLVFSHENLICFPANAVSAEGLYPMAAGRARAYCNLFPMEETEFHIALRNPATLIPALVAKVPDATYEAMMAGTAPMSLRWAPVLRAMTEAAPGVPFTVWCNEDTPLLWPEILRGLAGLGPEAALEGDFDLLAQIMSDEGMTAFKSYLDSHPPKTADQRRRVTTAFLTKFGRTEELEVELDLPGWTDDLVAAMTEAYDADCAEIAALPGVRFLAP